MNEEKRYNLNMTFNTIYAQKYGLDESIFLSNIIFWISINKANNNNQHDGKTWTYNSMTAFSKIFNFWSVGQIKRIIDSLKKQNIIISGNYNQSAYDRTLWYALVDEEILFQDSLNTNKCISTKQKMHTPDSNQPLADNKTSITDINTNSINSYINTNLLDESDKKEPEPESFNSEIILSTWNTFAKRFKLSEVAKITGDRYKKLKTRINEGMNLENILLEVEKSKFLLGVNDREWKIDFDWLIKNETNWVKISEGRYNQQMQSKCNGDTLERKTEPHKEYGGIYED